MLSSLIAQMPPSLGGNPEGPGQLGPSSGGDKMKTVQMKTGGFAIYDAPPALRKFLEARASGAPKELIMQLSAESLLEMKAEQERAAKPTRRNNLTDVVIDFNRARRGAT